MTPVIPKISNILTFGIFILNIRMHKNALAEIHTSVNIINISERQYNIVCGCYKSIDFRQLFTN